MVNESPRTNHNYRPPARGKRRDGFGGFLAGLAVVILGITLLAGPPMLGAWANGSFEQHNPFGR